MELTPEERRRIYEEEKARIEAEEKARSSPDGPGSESTVNLAPGVAGLLCYLGVWVTGIIFLVIEQKNRWIRFHAAQSIVVFASLFILGMIFRWIPFVGVPIATIIGIGGFILWIILMVKAYNGERFKVAIAGDLAESMAASSAFTAGEKTASAGAPANPAAETEDAPTASVHEAGPSLEERIDRRVKEQLAKQGFGSAVGSAFAIAWSTVLLVFFNFFNEYVAYYDSTTVGDTVMWTRLPLLTESFDTWLPIVNTALIIGIVGHIFILIFNRRLLNNILGFIIDAFALAAVVSLLAIYPFDFDVLPNRTAVTATGVSVTIALIAISVAFAISLVARLVKTLVFVARHSSDS